MQSEIDDWISDTRDVNQELKYVWSWTVCRGGVESDLVLSAQMKRGLVT